MIASGSHPGEDTMTISHALAGGALVFAAMSVGAHASVSEKTVVIAGTTVHYKLVVPENYDASKVYPAILAFPPGGQDMDMVDATLSGNYRREAERRGYIVIEPAAPGGDLFFEGGQRLFPAFVTKMLAQYKIKDGRFNAAGNSNGGLSAFLIASRYPQYFVSVTGFPGFLDNATDAGMSALGKLCIYMFAGGLDSGWPEAMRDQAAKLRARGYQVAFKIEPGQPHVIRTLTGRGAARLFDQFDAARQRPCAQ
jgi:pimeloyl-ACP methyl ester carboxylesterase